jgi:D-3-phosphoglycerate dehydrogenase
MAKFKVVLMEHGYSTTEYERNIIASAGGEFIDANDLALEKALTLCEEADAVMLRRIQVTAELIRRFRRCKIILRYGVGTDNVDVQAATEAGIIVGHVPSYCLDEVSSHAIGLLLACVRRIVRTHQKMERGDWDVHRNDPIWRMAGKTFGLVGFGQIAQTVARKLAGWDMHIIASDPFAETDRVRLVDLDTLCRESDYISIHAPLLPETRHLIGQKQFASMKRGVILVNTARGPLVDTTALFQALAEGQVAQAALDVFEEEPLPATSFLRAHPQVIVTDHVGWYSEESQIQLQKTGASEAVAVCLGGLPQSMANPEVLCKLGRFDEWVPSPTARWQIKRMQQLRAAVQCSEI